MGIATGFTFPSDGDTTNATNDLVNNFNILKDSVNNIVSGQITDGTIQGSDISSSAEIPLSAITATASDETLDNVLENYMDGCWLHRASDTQLTVTKGSIMINGELRRNTSDTNDTPSLTVSTWNDVWALADSAASTFTISVQTNQATPGASSNPGTNGRLIGSIYCDSDTDITGCKVIWYRPNLISGVSYITGDGTGTITETVTLGVTLEKEDFPPQINELGIKTSAGNPTTLTDFTSAYSVTSSYFPDTILTTSFVASFVDSGTFTNGDFHGYSFQIHGAYT